MISGTAAATAGSASSRPPSATANLRATVYELDPLLDPRWEALVGSDRRASVFHGTSWLRALQTTYGYDPLVITTSAPGSALTNGLVFCRVNSWLTGKRFVSLPFADHCEPLVSSSSEMDDLLLRMRKFVDSGEWKYIEIRTTRSWPGNQSGFTKNATYSLHRLDLGRNAQELFRSFHKDCVQRKIRRAERERLRYEEGTSETLLQKFYGLLLITRRRQGLPSQPLSWFRELITAFGNDLKIRLAAKDDMPVASILTLNHKKSMVYKYGCSDARFHKWGGVPFLFWNAIQDAKERGCEEFEMGRSDAHNLGLISFKKRWGTVRTELSYWTYPKRPAPHLSERQMAILRRVVPFTPTFALRIAGNLFYRHAG
ncbi:MAG TPA: GNAT family N-acetyltransferase [Terriglobales bacterium]|nr:GNAT family N-acetyltransferase [Terriglobales bacterium]